MRLRERMGEGIWELASEMYSHTEEKEGKLDARASLTV
jgi:hypothetical protein